MKDTKVFGVFIMSVFALMLVVVQSGGIASSRSVDMGAQVIDSTLTNETDMVELYTTDYTRTIDTKMVLEGPQEQTNIEPEATFILPGKRCPFVDGPNNTVVVFMDQFNRAVNIRPGVYAVELASYHVPNTISTSQNFHEMWHLELQDDQGKNVYQSPQIRDLKNEEMMAIELVEGRTTIHSQSYQTYARIDPDAQTVDGFTPLCASLRLLGDIPETTAVMTVRDIPTVEEVPIVQDESMQLEKMTDGVLQTTMTVRMNESPLSPPVVPVAEPMKFSSGTVLQARIVTEEVFSPEYLMERRKEVIRVLEEKTPFEILSSTNRSVYEEKVVSVLTSALEGGVGEMPIDFSRKSFEVEGTVQENNDPELPFEIFRFENRGELAELVDSDGDGITDYDEQYVYKTDPGDPFSSGSILTDGERVLLGLDPKKDNLETIPVESPRVYGEAHQGMFSIDTITLAKENTQEDLEKTKKEGETDKVVVKGHAEPLSFLTLFVYSTPIIVTVRTDKEGKFEYIFDEGIEDGTHELYVASVNASGKILAKSESISFIKTAEAIEYTPSFVSNAENPVDDAIQTFVTLSLFLVLLASIGVTVALGYFKTKYHSEMIDG